MRRKISSILGKVCIGIMLVGGLPSTAVIAANKIVLIAVEGSEGEGHALRKGFIKGLGLQFNPDISSYSLESGYLIEFEKFKKEDEKSEKMRDKTLSLLEQEDVVTVICHHSVVCVHALEEDASKDVLVITITATSNELSKGRNLLRLAPANELQARAMYYGMAQEIGTKRLAIVYEPDAYAMDFYTTFLSDYFRDIIFQEEQKPTFVAAIPLFKWGNTYNNIQVGEALCQQEVEVIAYFGYLEGFEKLINSTSCLSMVAYWYASDAVFEYEDVDKLTPEQHLRIYGVWNKEVEKAECEAECAYPEYYYGYDAAKFLGKVIAQVPPPENRKEFLDFAEKTVLDEDESLTGKKYFASKPDQSSSADQEGRFSVKIFPVPNEPTSNKPGIIAIDITDDEEVTQ